jgi:hypothetical protein
VRLNCYSIGLSRHGCVGLRDSHFPIQFTFLDHAFMGLVGAFDPVLELVVFDRHKVRDLINPDRAMPAGEYVVHTLADVEFVSGRFVLHARPVIKAASRLKFPREHDFRPESDHGTEDVSLSAHARI